MINDLLVRRGRLMVYCMSLWTAAVIYFTVGRTGDNRLSYQIITEYYALAAALMVYLALLVGPLLTVIPDLPGKKVLLRLRRSFGLSAFFFAVLHGGFALFKMLGGFSGLAYLSQINLFAVIMGIVNLFILTPLAATSFDAAVRWLGRDRWRRLHRLIYISGLLVVAHALLIGADFRNIGQPVYQVSLVAVLFMIALQLARVWMNRVGGRGEAK